MSEGSSKRAEVEGQSAGEDRQPTSPLSPAAIECPFCASIQVELFSLFGSQLLTSEYYCHGCRTVFEYLRG